VIELHYGIARPEPLANLLSRNHRAGGLEEHFKNAEGLFLKADRLSILAQFPGLEVELERPEANDVECSYFPHRTSAAFISGDYRNAAL